MGRLEDRRVCPECGSIETQQVDVGLFSDEVQEVRVCSKCDAQITNFFTLGEKEVFQYEDE